MRYKSITLNSSDDLYVDTSSQEKKEYEAMNKSKSTIESSYNWIKDNFSKKPNIYTLDYMNKSCKKKDLLTLKIN